MANRDIFSDGSRLINLKLWVLHVDNDLWYLPKQVGEFQSFQECRLKHFIPRSRKY